MAAFHHDVLPTALNHNSSHLVSHGATACHQACLLEYLSKRGLFVSPDGEAFTTRAPAAEEFQLVRRRTRSGASFRLGAAGVF